MPFTVINASQVVPLALYLPLSTPNRLSPLSRTFCYQRQEGCLPCCTYCYQRQSGYLPCPVLTVINARQVVSLALYLLLSTPGRLSPLPCTYRYQRQAGCLSCPVLSVINASQVVSLALYLLLSTPGRLSPLPFTYCYQLQAGCLPCPVLTVIKSYRCCLSHYRAKTDGLKQGESRRIPQSSGAVELRSCVKVEVAALGSRP